MLAFKECTGTVSCLYRFSSMLYRFDPCRGGEGKLSKMTHTILFSFHCIQYVGRLGLATSCSRFPKKWPEISQSCSKKMSKVAFCNETCSKGAKTKAKTCFVFSSFIWSDAKICNLYNKSNISKHCCAILRYNQHR